MPLFDIHVKILSKDLQTNRSDRFEDNSNQTESVLQSLE